MTRSLYRNQLPNSRATPLRAKTLRENQTARTVRLINGKWVGEEQKRFGNIWEHDTILGAFVCQINKGAAGSKGIFLINKLSGLANLHSTCVNSEQHPTLTKGVRTRLLSQLPPVYNQFCQNGFIYMGVCRVHELNCP